MVNIFRFFLRQIVGGYKLGPAIIEGKTKIVYDLPNNAGLCLLVNKDRITAGDGVKKHDMAGKAEISNATNGKVFSILNAAGLRTAYVAEAAPNAFVSRKCEMIPIEWVTRRLATGSYCRRYPSIKEGYRSVLKNVCFFYYFIMFTRPLATICYHLITIDFVTFYFYLFFHLIDKQFYFSLLLFFGVFVFCLRLDSIHQNRKHFLKMMQTMIHNGLKKKSFRPILILMV